MMIPSLVPSQTFTQGVVCAIIALVITQASLVAACTDGNTAHVQVKVSLKPKWMYTVRSPNFPDYYPRNTNCSWTFTVPGDYELMVALKHFQVEPSSECQSDYLHVSFTNHSIPHWKKYCSILSDNYINSLHLHRKIHTVPSERMMLMFVSDGSSEFRGFEGEVRTIAPALVPPHKQDDYSCDNYLNDSMGSFESPKYPQPYPTDMECMWHLSVPSGEKVHLRFTVFDLENTMNQDGDCANDYVEIREGVWGRRGGIILGRFCYNDTLPPDVTSPSNQMWIRFTSNYQQTNNTHRGFAAKFKGTPWGSGSRFLPSFIRICFCVFFVLIMVYY